MLFGCNIYPRSKVKWKSVEMFERSDFHESYYDHSCSIIPQKDVLETDISGNSCASYLKRKWNDLFLLSYGDKRARVYYTSSHAMRMERTKQFRRYRNRIHPLSKFRNFWDGLMVIVFILYKIIFHHNSSMIFGSLYHSMYYIAAALEMFIISDLLINMETGYIDDEARKIILDKKKGLLQYCSSKLFVHFASAIPLQCIMFLKYGQHICCSLCKANTFVCALKIFGIFSLYRVYESTKYWTWERESFKATHFFKFLRICVVGFITMLQFMDLSDTICLLMFMAVGEIDETSYLSYLLRSKFGITEKSANYKFFCFDFARICKSLLLFSFGFKQTRYYLDKMTSLVAYIIANIFCMWCLLESYAFIIRLKFPEDQVIINRAMTLNLIHCRQLPDKLRLKVTQFYDFKMSRLKGVRMQNGLYRSLPYVLKREAVLSCYYKYIVRIPYFAGWPIKITEDITLMLQEEVYSTSDLVAEPWARGDGLVIVDVGELAVYTVNEDEVGHMIDGEHFGELSLVTDNEIRMSYVVAITPCKILVLDKGAFRKYMRDYPDLFFKLKDQLKQKFRSKSVVEVEKTLL